MDKQQISRQLHRLAQEEIPDTMNLWPGLQARLKRKAKPRSFSLAHALSVFVMTILVAVGGYAAYQTSNASSDPIAPTYGVELNSVQTIDSITASLDWAYADENIIAIQYSLIYNPEFVPQPLSVASSIYTSDYPFPIYGTGEELEPLADGNLKSTFIRYYTVGDNHVEGTESVNLILDLMIYSQPDASLLQATALPPTASPIPFGQLEATVPPPDGQFQATVPPSWDNATATPIPWDAPSVTPSPASQFEPTVPPPDMTTLEPSLIPPIVYTATPAIYGAPIRPIHTFRFSFALPVHPSRTDQTISAAASSDELPISIRNISVSPLQTNFELCYPYPDVLGTWYPSVVVDTGFAPVDAARYSPIIETLREQYGKVYEVSVDNIMNFGSTNWQMGLDPITHSNCIPLSSFAPTSEAVSELDIYVDYLYRETDPTDLAVWNNDIDFFAARGFTLRYELWRNDSGDYSALSDQTNQLAYPLPIGSLLVTVQDYPDNMTFDEAQHFIYQNMLKERVEGDWSFHITLE